MPSDERTGRGRRGSIGRGRGSSSASSRKAGSDARQHPTHDEDASHDGAVASDDGSGTAGPAEPDRCWLCSRPFGLRIERHHPRPRSRGGRLTVPVHPICHRALHAAFSNIELARFELERQALAAQPEMKDFLAWIAGKPPDFHAPTRGRKR